MGSEKFMNGYLGICTDGLKFIKMSQMMPKIIKKYILKLQSMLHESVKLKIQLPMASQKFMNGYLGICTDGFNFPRL